jgi:hypothetical protein
MKQKVKVQNVCWGYGKVECTFREAIEIKLTRVNQEMGGYNNIKSILCHPKQIALDPTSNCWGRELSSTGKET